MGEITRSGDDEPGIRRSIPVWWKVSVAFVAAIAFQVVLFAYPPFYGGNEPPFNTLGRLYLPLVLFFYFGPGLIAFLVSLLLLRSRYREQDTTVPGRVVLALTGITLLSCIVGVLVSFAMWGAL